MKCKNFTILVQSAQGGDRCAENAVYRVAFRKLRSIAASLLSRESPGHSLQPTELVGELFFKFRNLHHDIAGRDHFFRLSGRAMRQVLVDHARKKNARKRDDPGEAFFGKGAGETDPELQLAVRQAMERLRGVDDLAADTIWLRRVDGCTLDEIAHMQGRKVWRVRADYDYGMAWMSEQLTN